MDDRKEPPKYRYLLGFGDRATPFSEMNADGGTNPIWGVKGASDWGYVSSVRVHHSIRGDPEGDPVRREGGCN